MQRRTFFATLTALIGAGMGWAKAKQPEIVRLEGWEGELKVSGYPPLDYIETEITLEEMLDTHRRIAWPERLRSQGL